MLTAAVVYGITVTVVAAVFAKWWFLAEREAGEAKERGRVLSKKLDKEAKRRLDAETKSEELRLEMAGAETAIRALQENVQQANRDRESLSGFLKAVTAERDAVIGDRNNRIEAAQKAAKAIGEQLDRLLATDEPPF